jgi:hypothetical protein
MFYFWQSINETPYNTLENYVLNYTERTRSTEESMWEKVYDSDNRTLLCDIYRYEDGIDNIVNRVSAIINARSPAFPIMRKLYVRLKTGIRADKRHYREVYTPEMRNVIERECREDLERFGYEW